MDVWRERSFRATIVLLLTSALLILPALAGVEASLPLFAAFVVVAGLLAVSRSWLASLPRVLEYDLGTYAPDAWLSPLVAIALVGVLAPAATAPELQAIGGLAGFVGMMNYFVRPLYLFVFGLLRAAVGRAQNRLA